MCSSILLGPQNSPEKESGDQCFSRRPTTMEVVGESIISSAIDVVFGKLASTDLLKFAREEEVNAEPEGWMKELRRINEVLGEYEEKQITMSSVKDWVHDFQGLAYDMEDVLDGFAAELLRHRFMPNPPQSNKVGCLFPTCFAGSNPISRVKLGTGSKIKEITRRLDDISSRKAKLGLDNTVHGVERSEVRNAYGAAATTWHPTPTTSLMNEPVHGRDVDKNLIVEMLLKDKAAGKSSLEVIPIVGIRRMGKTTVNILCLGCGCAFRMRVI